jgi:hypothetical protein
MVYFFDTSSLIVLSHYFPDRFPSFWERFDQMVSKGRILSCREVMNELDSQATRPHLLSWIKANKKIFLTPSRLEQEFVAEIFRVPHFQNLIGQRQRVLGKPVADPFVIAAARIASGCAVTEEAMRDNAAKVPNICQHFNIPWMNIEGFMEKEGWVF